MNIWDDFWRFFFPMPGAPSPREMLYRYVLEDLLRPKQIDLITGQYFDVLSFFATLLAPFVILGFVITAYQSVRHHSSRPVKQWVASAAYVLGLLAVAPLLITWLQYFLALVGSTMLGFMLGTDDLDKAIQALMTLTGDPSFDAALGFIQIIFLVILAFELKLVLVALYASAVALLIGLALRFLPWVGEPMYTSGIRISIFGISGYLNVMLVMAIVIGAGEMIVGNNPWGRGIINVLAIVASVAFLWSSLTSLKGQLQAVVQGAIEGYNHMRGSSSSSSHGRSSGRSGPQTATDATDHLKGTRSHGGHGHTASTTTQTGSAHARVVSQLSKEKTEAQGRNQPPSTPPRAASTAARIARVAAGKIPAPQVQAAVAAYDTAKKVKAGTRALQSLAQAPKTPDAQSEKPDRQVHEVASTSHEPHNSVTARKTSQPSAEATAAAYRLRYRTPPSPQPPPSRRVIERENDA